MEINRTRKLNNDQFYPATQVKKSIFLHHTAGTSASGAIDWWNQTPDHVGTAYVLDRDGTIYEVFDPKSWGYHLGVRGDDNWQEKHSIGIELVSAGQLYKEKDGNFYFYPLFPNKAAAKKIDPSEVVSFKDEWRGFNHYHKYTEEQVIATKELLKHLQKEHNIEKNVTPIRKLMEFNPKVCAQHWGGTFTHTSVRKDKNDLFPQEAMIKAIDEAVLKSKSVPSSPEYTTKSKRKSKKK